MVLTVRKLNKLASIKKYFILNTYLNDNRVILLEEIDFKLGPSVPNVASSIWPFLH